MPHPGEDAPLWPLIGCRRGPLREAISPQLICPGPKQPQQRGIGTSAPTRRCPSVDVAERCLLSAESQRLADMKAVLEGASCKLSITEPSLQNGFFDFIEAGQYRDRISLQRSYSSRGRTFTYTELIAIIAWELAENHTVLPSLEIKSWESFIAMLETAGIYESEVGQVSQGAFPQAVAAVANHMTDVTGDSFHGLSQTLPRSAAPSLSQPPVPWSP